MRRDGAGSFNLGCGSWLATRNVSLSYDPLGRLWQVSGNSGTRRFVYDGDALVAEYDQWGNMLKRARLWRCPPDIASPALHGESVDTPLVWFEGAGISASERRFLFTNHQGSVTAIADGWGNTIAINRYDEYGIPGAGNIGRFQYTGQAWLEDLGMYHYKARIYSPTLGRFLQTDPIGYEDQINLYAYVGNDPVNKRDPTGMECANSGDATEEENATNDCARVDTITVTASKPVKDRRDDADRSIVTILDVDVIDPVTAMAQYVSGRGGTVCLTFKQFSDIVRNGTDTSDKIPVAGKDLTANTISTYGSGIRLGRSIGSATVYKSEDGYASGLYDRYNFDSKASGSRSSRAESETRLGSMIPGKPYDIVYPCDGVN